MDKKEVKGLSIEEINEIDQAFSLYGNEYNEIDIVEFKQVIRALKLDKQYPTIYKIIDTMTDKNYLTREEFINKIGEKIGDKNTYAGIRKLFDFLNTDRGLNYIKIEKLQELCDEFNITISKEAMDYIYQVKKGGSLSFEEFFNVVTKVF